MSAAFLLFCISAGTATWSWFVNGTVTDLALLAWLSAIAAAIQTVIDLLRGRGDNDQDDWREEPVPRPIRSARPVALPAKARAAARVRPDTPSARTDHPGQRALDRAVVVDGSNVMFWNDNTPDLESLRLVLRTLEVRGMTPLVGFDANVGHVIAGRYMGPGDMAALLDLSPEQVAVAPKGTPADPLLIAEAQRLDASIVTNDRYRDWTKKFPDLARPGFLIPGRIRDGILEMGDLLRGGLPQAA